MLIGVTWLNDNTKWRKVINQEWNATWHWIVYHFIDFHVERRKFLCFIWYYLLYLNIIFVGGWWINWFTIYALNEGKNLIELSTFVYSHKSRQNIIDIKMLIIIACFMRWIVLVVHLPSLQTSTSGQLNCRV